MLDTQEIAQLLSFTREQFEDYLEECRERLAVAEAVYLTLKKRDPEWQSAADPPAKRGPGRPKGSINVCRRKVGDAAGVFLGTCALNKGHLADCKTKQQIAANAAEASA